MAPSLAPAMAQTRCVGPQRGPLHGVGRGGWAARSALMRSVRRRAAVLRRPRAAAVLRRPRAAAVLRRRRAAAVRRRPRQRQGGRETGARRDSMGSVRDSPLECDEREHPPACCVGGTQARRGGPWHRPNRCESVCKAPRTTSCSCRDRCRSRATGYVRGSVPRIRPRGAQQPTGRAQRTS